MKKTLLEELRDALGKHNKEEIAELLSSYENALKALSFIEKEKEMRIKFPDVWKMQLEQAKISVDQLQKKIIELGSQYSIDIEGIFKKHDSRKLSFENFSNIQ